MRFIEGFLRCWAFVMLMLGVHFDGAGIKFLALTGCVIAGILWTLANVFAEAVNHAE